MYRYSGGTVPVQWRYRAGTVEVQYRYSAGTVQVQFMWCLIHMDTFIHIPGCAKIYIYVNKGILYMYKHMA